MIALAVGHLDFGSAPAPSLHPFYVISQTIPHLGLRSLINHIVSAALAI
jgi:hypothetical protein